MHLLGVVASSYLKNTASFNSISTTTIGAGGGSVIFNVIPQTYKHLQLRVLYRATSSQYNSGGFRMRLNGDTNANYSWHYLYGNGSTIGSQGFANQTEISISEGPTATSPASVFGVGIIDILDYTNTNIYKTTRHLAGYNTQGSQTDYIMFSTGNYRSTSAISSLTVFYALTDPNLAQYSSFALYGIS